MTTPLDKLNSKVFSEHLHTKFNVQVSGATPLQLELVEVIEGDASLKTELFSLHFRGPSTPRLAQQTHRLEHDKLGSIEIFLTAIGSEPEKGILYESVFHRLRKTTP